MSPEVFIFDQIVSGAKAAGCTEQAAKSAASNAVERFKQNRFQGKAGALIAEHIREAKKLSKKSQAKARA